MYVTRLKKKTLSVGVKKLIFTDILRVFTPPYYNHIFMCTCYGIFKYFAITVQF